MPGRSHDGSHNAPRQCDQTRTADDAVPRRLTVALAVRQGQLSFALYQAACGTCRLRQPSRATRVPCRRPALPQQVALPVARDGARVRARRPLGVASMIWRRSSTSGPTSVEAVEVRLPEQPFLLEAPLAPAHRNSPLRA